MLRLAALLLIATAALAGEPAAAPARTDEPPARVQNRVSLGVLGVFAQTPAVGNLELQLSDRLRVRFRERDGLKAELRFDGRVGFRLLHGGQLDRTRITALGLHLEHERFSLDAGRFRVHGSWRLADGVQAMLRLGRGFELGGWFGEVPDPFTTAPAPRVGGGPLFRFVHAKGQASVGLELAGTQAGLDRLALLLAGRVEPVKRVEIALRADLQRTPDVPLVPADLSLTGTFDPRDDLRLHAGYSAWSGLACLQGLDRDPGLSRLAARFNHFSLGDHTTANDAVDPSLYHQAGGGLRWTPKGERAGAVLGFDGRYRHHDLATRRHARARLTAGVQGLLGDRLSLITDHSAVYWRQRWRWEGGITARIEPDPTRLLSLDASARVSVSTVAGEPRPTLYADVFADLLLPQRILLSFGYRFTNELDTDAWNAAHVALVRATWTVRSPGRRP